MCIRDRVSTQSTGTRKGRMASTEATEAEHAAPPEEAALWQPDYASETCCLCGVRFWLFKRRHHCRKCGLLVCGSCSVARVPLPFLKAAARVCDRCVGFERSRETKTERTNTGSWFGASLTGWCQNRTKGSGLTDTSQKEPSKPAGSSEFYWDKSKGWVKFKPKS
eukprot:TRINITY_DN9584_c0_g1_i5.p1 TRINITY_DN9584_c0_g1~~TRINITY_DN9584_c0_g1_i5.p1  ORF type:complete len:165 (-),score=12.27 TRINITY_DN9584_c0_g1_i5:356-850(-)